MRIALGAWGLAVTLLAGGAGMSQCVITTSFLGGNSQKGCMFDVVATQPVVISSFEQNLLPGTHSIEIYSKASTWVGFHNSPGSWNLIGSAAGIVSLGAGLPTPLPIPVNILIGAGSTRAFYVTSSATLNLAYSNGTAVGTIGSQDASIQILEGSGINYPFAGAPFQPRLWNGKILYYAAGLPEYQVNQAGASLTMDDLQGTPCSKAVLHRTICAAGGSATTTFAGNLASTAIGLPFNVVFTSMPAIPTSAGALITAGVQIVNLDLGDPTLTPLFGGLGVPFANGSIPLNVNFPIDTTVQMVILDPTSPDGLRLSQANELHVTVSPSPAPTPGPLNDDAFVTHAFANLPCGPASFPFYGTSYAAFSVVSNGRVMFGTPSADYLPTVASAMVQSRSIDAWVDLNPDAATGGAGSIAVTIPAAGIVRVQWTGVRYYASVGSGNTFAIVMDTATGAITIDGVSTFQPLPAAPNMFLGLSPGAPSATNPGPVTFAQGGPVAGPSNLGMLYEHGPTGTLAAGLAGIVFVPNGAGNYDWVGY